MSKNCKFLKKDGTQCRAGVQTGKDSCVFHDPLQAEEVRRGRRQGGIKRSRQFACLAYRTPDRPLTTSAEISSFLADTTNQVRRRRLDPGVGNTIGYLASVQLASLRQGKVEDHLSKLEDCLGLIPRTAISNHLGEKEPNLWSVPRRVERLLREVELQAFIRCERIIENMTDDELEHLAVTGEWPNRARSSPMDQSTRPNESEGTNRAVERESNQICMEKSRATCFLSSTPPLARAELRTRLQDS